MPSGIRLPPSSCPTLRPRKSTTGSTRSTANYTRRRWRRRTRWPICRRRAAERRQRMRYKALVLLLLVALALAGCSSGAALTPVEHPVQKDAPFVLQGIKGVKQVARLIGAESINKTDRYGVAGADLGSMFNMGDKTYFVFGDTFGVRAPGMSGGGGEDWRSNVMAVTGDDDPSDGITFERFIADGANHANELIPSAQQDGVEITRIPTLGVAAGSAMYLYFMSVRHWGDPGKWDANYAGV